MATNNALNNSSNPLTVGNLILDTNALSSSSGNIVLAPVSGSSVSVSSAPLTVGNLSLATNTLSSSSGNIVLAPVSGSSVSINSSYTLPSTIGTSGQVLASNGSGALTFQTPTSADMPWTKISTGTTAVTMVKGNGYINANGTSNVTFTLPSVAAVGDTFEILNASFSFEFIIKLNTAQEIYVGNEPGPIGTVGDVRSVDLGDWIQIICLNDSTSFLCCVKQGNVEVNLT